MPRKSVKKIENEESIKPDSASVENIQLEIIDEPQVKPTKVKKLTKKQKQELESQSEKTPFLINHYRLLKL